VCDGCSKSQFYAGGSSQRACNPCVAHLPNCVMLVSRLADVGQTLHELSAPESASAPTRPANIEESVDFCEGMVTTVEGLHDLHQKTTAELADMTEKYNNAEANVVEETKAKQEACCECQRLNDALEAMEKERDTVQQQVEALTNDLAASRDSLASTKAESERREQLRQELEKNVEALQSSLATAQSEQAVALERAAAAESKASSLQTEVDALEANIAQTEDDVAKRRSLQEQLESELEALKAAHDEVRTSRDNAMQRSSDADERASNLDAEIETLRARHREVETARDGHEQRAGESEQRLQSTEADLLKAHEKHQGFKDEVSQMESERAKAEQRTSTLEDEIVSERRSQQQNQVKKFQEAMDSGTDQLIVAQSERDLAKRKVRDLEQRLKTLESEKTEVDKRLATALVDIDEATKRADADMTNEFVSTVASEQEASAARLVTGPSDASVATVQNNQSVGGSACAPSGAAPVARQTCVQRGCEVM